MIPIPIDQADPVFLRMARGLACAIHILQGFELATGDWSWAEANLADACLRSCVACSLEDVSPYEDAGSALSPPGVGRPLIQSWIRFEIPAAGETCAQGTVRHGDRLLVLDHAPLADLGEPTLWELPLEAFRTLLPVQCHRLDTAPPAAFAYQRRDTPGIPGI